MVLGRGSASCGGDAATAVGLLAAGLMFGSCGWLFPGQRADCVVPEVTLLDAYESIDVADRVGLDWAERYWYGPGRADYSVNNYEESCELLVFDLRDHPQHGVPAYLALARFEDAEEAAEMFKKPGDDRYSYVVRVPGVYMESDPSDALQWGAYYLVDCVIVKAGWFSQRLSSDTSPESRDVLIRGLLEQFPPLCD